MSDTADPTGRGGWEHLFQNETFPPRFQTFADPNPSVVVWADSLPPGASILDVGCGVGRHVVYLGGRGFKLAGMDLSSTGIERTRKACDARQIAFEGRVAEMTALPWADATFDATLSTSTVCHHRRADIVKTLDEVWRVLRPGGSFLVDFLHQETLSYQRAREQVLSGRLTEVEPETFADVSPEPDPLDDAFLPHHYCDEAEVRDLLKVFELEKLWADLPGRTADGGLSPRGYWVAWGRKPIGS